MVITTTISQNAQVKFVFFLKADNVVELLIFLGIRFHNLGLVLYLIVCFPYVIVMNPGVTNSLFCAAHDKLWLTQDIVKYF